MKPADSSPSRIGRYRVLEQLGEGGMGRVFLAEDEALRRRVALKILKRSDKESRRRFVREARAAARVSHPNLCPIFDVGEENGQPFLAMELLAGETLAAKIRTGPLAPAETLRLAEDLLAGLAALHETGIVHRDVKPSNFFLTPHGGRLVDFGLASEPRAVATPVIGSTPEVTSPGQLHGTPGYMAPEQILGHTADARTDLFAAGAMLYEALTGRRPFPGAQAAALSATLYDEPEPLVGSPELVALDPPIRRALAKKGAQRFASAPEMAEALRHAAGLAQLDDTAPTHHSPGHPEKTRMARRWAVLGAAAIAAAVTWLVAERTPPPPLEQSLPRSSSEAAPTTAPAPSDGGPKAAAATAGTVVPSSKTHGPAPIPTPVGQASPVATPESSPGTDPAPAAPAPPPADAASSTLAVQALVHALGSEDPAIRAAAAEALAGIGINVGTLKLRIRPWANVSVDGRAVGTTPLRALTLVAGDHAVRLEHPLFEPFVLTAAVRAGLTTELDVDLRRDAVRRAQ